MPMRRAVSMLGRGTMKSLKWRLVFTKARYSARCSSSLCLKACHAFRSGVPWEALYADDFVIIAESLKECARRLLTWKEATEEKRLRVNTGKMKIMICGMGLDLFAEFRQISMCRLLRWSEQQQHLLQWLQALGAQEMQLAQALDNGSWLRCQGTASPWMAYHRGKSDLTSWRW